MGLFTKETFSFLMENRFRDNRDWFHAHKEEYQRLVLEPLQNFVTSLSPAMLDIDGEFVTEPKVDKTISRIYRDTRFTKDKSLYRDHMWVLFCRERKLYHGPPCFFFEITPDYYRYGCGYYQASGQEMDAIRQLILEGHAAFTAARKRYEGQDVFQLAGDVYKRNRFPEADASLVEWINRKNLLFLHDSTDFELLLSEELVPTIAERFRLLAPMYRFLLEAHARALRA